MPMGNILDVFNNDAFKLRSMCEAINKIPPMFNYLGSEGIFKEQGSSSTTVAIEENQGKLSLMIMGIMQYKLLKVEVQEYHQ